MANRNFNSRQALEKEVKELHAEIQPAVLPVESEAVLNLTTDITLTSVDVDYSARNGTTFELVVNAAAANPTATILVAFTGTAAAIICTVTPNDGTNNAATPVDLNEDELAELINSGVVVGKTITLTDASSLRALQTAAGGMAADALTAGDDQEVEFENGVTAESAAFIGDALGFASVERTDVGEYTITLQDTYNKLKAVQAILKTAVAEDIMWQVQSETVATDKEIVLWALAGATPAEVSDESSILVKVELKNSSVGYHDDAR